MTKFVSHRSLCALFLLLAVAAMPLAAQDKVSPVDNPPVIGNAPTGGAVLISQAPNQVNGFFNDTDCDFCAGGTQTIAENFVLTGTVSVGQVMWWAGWFPGDNFTPDPFEFNIYSDSGGVPGALMSNDGGVPSATATGVVLFGVSEYEMFMSLSGTSLDAGTYWLEIYGDSAGNTDSIFWETGNVDPTNGITGSAWFTTTPGGPWNSDPANDMAYVLFEGTGVPTMGAMSFALLAAVLLGLSLATLAHFRKRQV